MEGYIVAVGIGIVVWRVIRWMAAPCVIRPDPWPQEVELAIHDPAVEPACHRCLTPHPDERWFCPVCGAAVGPYNNYMPYLQLFSEGEVLRSGILDHYRRSIWVITGYVLLSLCLMSVFAPVYWFFLIRHMREQRARERSAPNEA